MFAESQLDEPRDQNGNNPNANPSNYIMGIIPGRFVEVRENTSG